MTSLSTYSPRIVVVSRNDVFLTSISKLYSGRILMNIYCKGQSDRSVWLLHIFPHVSNILDISYINKMRSAASDRGLHCLPRSVYLNTKGKYGVFIYVYCRLRRL